MQGTDRSQPGSSEPPAHDDPTGEKRLTWNVAVSWATQLLTIVIGFVMPRLIDENLGQVSLGIWDFGWAIVSYLSLVNFGLGSNSSYYVATYRAEGNTQRLNEALSSAHLVQVAISLIVVGATLATYAFLPSWLPDTVSEHAEDGRMMVLFLGLSLTAQMLFDAYRGLLTGVHRWDVHNGINTLHYLLSAIGMVATLLSGLGLVALAVVYFLSTVVTEILRYFAARRYCPEARLRFRLANRADVHRVTVFGMKNLIAMAGPMGIQQTVSVLITMRLGPTMLATFARPAALIRHMEVFILKFAFVIMPTTSSLKGMGRSEDLKTFSIEMSKVGWAMAIPASIFLYVYGPQLIELWMGPDYVVADLMMLLAVAGGMTAANRPAYRILFGLDEHGPVSKASLVVYLTVLAIGIPAMMLADVGLMEAAVMYVIGDVIFNLIIVPHHLARVLGMNYGDYLWQVSHRAIAIGALSFVVLHLLSTIDFGNLAINIAIAAVVHGVFVLTLYWWFLLSDSLKTKLWSKTPFARSV